MFTLQSAQMNVVVMASSQFSHRGSLSTHMKPLCLCTKISVIKESE
jgi:hypothetical protein